MQLDKEPYQVQLEIRRMHWRRRRRKGRRRRAFEGQKGNDRARPSANRFQLMHAIEEVNTKIADLETPGRQAREARATLAATQANRKRGEDVPPPTLMLSSTSTRLT